MYGKTPQEKIYELSLTSSKAATSIPPLLLDKVSSFFLELVGAQHICWDYPHTLQHFKRKQIMAPYKINQMLEHFKIIKDRAKIKP